jgi:hypothetical protein
MIVFLKDNSDIAHIDVGAVGVVCEPIEMPEKWWAAYKMLGAKIEKYILVKWVQDNLSAYSGVYPRARFKQLDLKSTSLLKQ